MITDQPHKITSPDKESQIGICSICGPVRIKSSGKLDAPKIRWRCYPRYKNNKKRERDVYRRHKKDVCEKCGFIPEHKVQLDVDHIDGNKKNNDPTNLQTLCANCHRLKTHINKDHIKQKRTPTQDFS